MKTINQVRANYWSYLQETRPELAAQRRSRKSQNDYVTDIRLMFCDYVDQLRRSGEITEQLANRVTL